MKTEKVFEIIGEGARFCIKRQKNQTEEKFLYNQNEFDPTDEGLDINESREYPNFNEAFQQINKYSWYMLCIKTVHNDYRDYVIGKLIEKLNEKSVKTDYFFNYSKNGLEEILKIELKYKLNENEIIWNYKKIDE